MAGSRLELTPNEDGVWIFADEGKQVGSKLMSLATIEKGPVTIHRLTRGGAKDVHHTYLISPRSRYVRVKDAWMDWWDWPIGKSGWMQPPASALWILLGIWGAVTGLAITMILLS